MKYLNVPGLSELGFEIAELELGGVSFDAKLEVYSCKAAGLDKKLSKSLETKFVEEFGGSSPTTPAVGSATSQSMVAHYLAPAAASPASAAKPLGTWSEPSARRVLINLICTLNASYPDYDFTNISVDQLTREHNLHKVVSRIDATLEAIYRGLGIGFRERLWRQIEVTIGGLAACELYSFINDIESEDLQGEGGTLWSFHFFFYNKRAKKVLFFACSATNGLFQSERLEDEDETDSFMDDYNDDSDTQFGMD